MVDNYCNKEDEEKSDCINLQLGGRSSDDQGCSPRPALRMWEKVQRDQNTNIR